MQKTSKRPPAVAGQFYPASAAKLREQIESLSAYSGKEINAVGCVLPHAGYIYSGKVAAQTLAWVRVKDTVILIGPNHTGFGPDFSIMTGGIWQTPLGEVEIDSVLADKLIRGCRYLKEDDTAHAYEHCLEVELPFLQYKKSDIKIVPITVAIAEASIFSEIGRNIASAIDEAGLKESVLLAASSDFTHYEPAGQARIKDRIAIDAILKLDENQLIKSVAKEDISMCGAGAIAVVLSASKALGAKGAQLVSYSTSGDITGDNDSVVGYAGIIIT